MYPTLFHFALDLFGVEVQLFKLINTFGFFLALAFLAAARCLSSELARKTEQGLLARETKIVSAPRPPTLAELLSGALGVFVLGFKVFGVVLGGIELHGGEDAQRYLLSWQGHWPAGLALAVAWSAYRYQTGKRLGDEPKSERRLEVTAAHHTMGITGAAAIGGLIGAKVFHLLERPASILELIRNPSVAAIASGLTIYGGLIVGSLAAYRYCRRANLSFTHVCDAVSPGLLLAYAIGRMGCQMSGDGDWGIVSPGAPGGVGAFVPDWFWAYDYPNNVLGVGVPMAEGGFPGYGTHLVPSVYPTPLYEALVALLLFALLWSVRTRLHRPALMSSIYLVANGVERFAIESIRVNATYDIAGWSVTQAQVISVLVMAGGVALMTVALRRPLLLAPEPPLPS